MVATMARGCDSAARTPRLSRRGVANRAPSSTSATTSPRAIDRPRLAAAAGDGWGVARERKRTLAAADAIMSAGSGWREPLSTTMTSYSSSPRSR